MKVAIDHRMIYAQVPSVGEVCDITTSRIAVKYWYTGLYVITFCTKVCPLNRSTEKKMPDRKNRPLLTKLKRLFVSGINVVILAAININPVEKIAIRTKIGIVSTRVHESSKLGSNAKAMATATSAGTMVS